MKLPVRPALPNITTGNDAHLTRPSSTYKSGNVVQTSGATSESTVRYLGIEVDDALEISEQTEI